MGKLSNFFDLFKRNSSSENNNINDNSILNEHENVEFNLKDNNYNLNQIDINENINAPKELKISNYALNNTFSNESDFLKLFKYDSIADSSKTFNIETALNNNWDKVDNFAKDVSQQMEKKADLDENGKVLASQLPEISSSADGITITDTAGNFTSTNVEEALEECFQYANDGKTAIKSAISNKGVAVTLEDTFLTLASKITAQMCKFSGNAVASDVISGKTFINSSGNVITGTIPMATKDGIGVIQGYPNLINAYDGMIDFYIDKQVCLPYGYIRGYIPNFKAGNIKKGVNVGGVVGSYESKIIPYKQRYVNGRNFGGTSNHFVACNGNSALLFNTTPNTTIITKTTTTSVDSTQHGSSVRFGTFGDYWIMFKSYGIYYSTDGKNWVLSVDTSCVGSSLKLYQYQGVTACIGYTYNSGDYPYLYYTTNGTTWTKSNLSNRVFTEYGFIKKVGSDYYVFSSNRNISSSYNYYYKSVGGLGSLVQKTNSNDIVIFDIEYYNGKYYGVGQYDRLYESNDEINWTLKYDSNKTIVQAKFLKVFKNRLYLINSYGVSYFDSRNINASPTGTITPVLTGDVYDVCVTNGTMNILLYKSISGAYTDIYSVLYSDDGEIWYSAGVLTFYSSSTNFTQVFETPSGLLAIDEFKKIIAIAE